MRVCDKCRNPLKRIFKLNIEAYGEGGIYIPKLSRNLEVCEDCYNSISRLVDSADDKTVWVEPTIFGKTYFSKSSKLTAVGSGLVPQSLIINCKRIVLEDQKLGIDIDVANAMENCNTVIINDNKFIRPSNATKVWRVIGYAGRSDYDGPEDDNLDFRLELDSSITKDEVLSILTERYKKYRNTVFKLYIEE